MRLLRIVSTPLLIGLLVVGILIVNGCTRRTAADKVVAEVNGEKIFNSEVEKQLNAVIGSHGSQLQGEEGKKMIEAFRKQILDNLIDNLLIIQEAKRQGFKATQKEIQARIDEIKKSFPSEKEYKAALEQNGLTEADVPGEVEKMILAEKLLEKVLKGIEVSDKEISDYYEKNKSQFEVPESVEIAHIFVQGESSATSALNEIKKGLSFEEAVSKYSEDTSTKLNKGNLGMKPRTTLEQAFGKEFSDAVFKLTKGEVSKEIIKSQVGFHIVKLISRKKAGIQTLEEAKDQIKNQLLNQKQREVYDKWLAEIKKKAEIKKYI